MSKATRYIIAALTVPLLGLAACGGSDETAAPDEGEASIDCETATQDEWTEHCMDEAPEDGGPVDEEQSGGAPIPLGEPFEYQKVMSDDTPTSDWSVTLTEVECGLATIPEAEYNPDWDGSDDIPEYIDAKPDEGNDFCILHWDWENVGEVPGQVDYPGDMMLGDEQHARSDEDVERSGYATDTHLGDEYSLDVNPGGTSKTLAIYQVPAGVTMDAVWFPAESMVSPSWLLVGTK